MTPKPHWTLWATLALALAAGCSAPMTAPPDPLRVEGVDYDTVFDAAVAALERDYDVTVRDRQAGIVSTDYRLDRTLPEFFGQDSRSLYHRMEATMHLIRHRVAVGITPSESGAVEVVVTAYRQRQSYSGPPEPERMPHYAVDDPGVGRVDPVALEGPQSNWENQPGNHELEARLYAAIARRIDRASR